MKKIFRKPSVVFLSVILGWITFSITIILITKGFDSSNLSNLGQFGDSFNILTSLFTGLAFAGVIISVRLQKEELIKVSNEMVSQSFDNKFFQMLNLFNSLIDSFMDKQVSPISTPKHNGELEREIIVYEKREVLKVLKSNFEYKKIMSRDNFQIEFEKFNQQYDTTFKFYFINLYQILKYIDRQFDKDINSAKNYTNIVRAQLSKDELVLLFYNAIGVIPFSGKNYKKLVEKYAFFEHLTYEDLNPNRDRDIVDILLKEYHVSAFGKNENLKTKVLELQENNS